MSYKTLKDAYIEAMFWTEQENLPEEVDVEHLAPETMRLIDAETYVFWRRNQYLMKGYDEQAGHDFWLTRNGHGSGFWDRPELYGEYPASKLTSRAESFGEINLTLGDDGLLYLE